MLSLRDEYQKRIRPNLHHPTYNERHQKIIELIDWTLEKYKDNIKKVQQNEQPVIINNIIEELDKKRDIAINQNNSNKNEEHMTKNTINKFENHLLSIKAEHQNQIRPNLHHPTYNERHQKIIELIDWTLERYKKQPNIKNNQQNGKQEVITDNIIEELDKKREVAINKKEKAILKDEVLEYGEEDDAIDYILFIIRERTGKLY